MEISSEKPLTFLLLQFPLGHLPHDLLQVMPRVFLGLDFPSSRHHLMNNILLTGFSAALDLLPFWPRGG